MKGSGEDVAMKEFILENWKYAFWILFASGFVFEIAPIKFSPITSFLGWLGKKLNRDVKNDILQVKTKVDEVQFDLQSHKVESWRRDILNFSNSLMRGENKSREGFEFIILTHDNYEEYLKVHKLDNGQVSLAYDYIKERYQDCIKNNSFYYGK